MTGKGLEFSSLVGPTVVLLSMPLDCQDHGFRVVIGRKLRSQGCQQATLSMVLVKDVQSFGLVHPTLWQSTKPKEGGHQIDRNRVEGGDLLNSVRRTKRRLSDR